MGYSSDQYIEMMEDDEYDKKVEWIQEKLGDDADEYTPGWYELSDQYDEIKYYESENYEPSYEEYGDYLSVYGKSPYDLFNEIITNSNELYSIEVSKQANKNLLVMLYGHIVAATEAYLSSSFINAVNESETVLRKLVENDPKFASIKFTIKEIYEKKETLKDYVSGYLKDFVFHDIYKVKPMYKDVLGIDFGDVGWLFRAVLLRHHCVHRAGYDKDGNEVDISGESIKELSNNCKVFVDSIENEIVKLPKGEPPF
jgi:hypothetical protein